MELVGLFRNIMILVVMVSVVMLSVYVYDFMVGGGVVQGLWVMNLMVGVGIWIKNLSCLFIGDLNVFGCGVGVNINQWGYVDNGDLNYCKGQLFSIYVSVISELLLKMLSEGLKFMVCGMGMYDFMVKNMNCMLLLSIVVVQVVYNVQLFDLWVQKDFMFGGCNVYVWFGNQVINWGESMFVQSGINVINFIDMQKLLIFGLQFKQVLLLVLMVSFVVDLLHGFSIEVYYQFQWNGNCYLLVGLYWLVMNGFGCGVELFMINMNNLNVIGLSVGMIVNVIGGLGVVGNQDMFNVIRNGFVNGVYVGLLFNDIGLLSMMILLVKYWLQFGVKFNYLLCVFDVNFVFYYLNYIDKLLVFVLFVNGIE